MTLRTHITRDRLRAIDAEIQQEIDEEQGSEEERIEEFLAMTDEEQDALIDREGEVYARAHRERMSRLSRDQLVRYYLITGLERCLRCRMRLQRLSELRAPDFVLRDSAKSVKNAQRWLLKVRVFRQGGPEPSEDQ